VIKSFKPETALRGGSSIDDFVRLLHDVYHVRVIYVCQAIMRQNQSAFNCKAKLLTKYLRVVLKPVPYAQFWGHKGFWRPSNNIYVRDGVHLNLKGQGKFYRSLRGAILKACLLFPITDLPGPHPSFTRASIFCSYLAMLLPFVVSLSLSSYCSPFILLGAFYYGYTQFNYSSLELIVAFSVFV